MVQLMSAKKRLLAAYRSGNTAAIRDALVWASERHSLPLDGVEAAMGLTLPPEWETLKRDAVAPAEKLTKKKATKKKAAPKRTAKRAAKKPTKKRR